MILDFVLQQEAERKHEEELKALQKGKVQWSCLATPLTIRRYCPLLYKVLQLSRVSWAMHLRHKGCCSSVNICFYADLKTALQKNLLLETTVRKLEETVQKSQEELAKTEREVKNALQQSLSHSQPSEDTRYVYCMHRDVF